MRTRDVPNSGLRLFGRIRIRIRIVLPDEHFDTAHTVLIFITSLNSCGCLYGRVCMLPSHDPLPLIRLIVSQNQAFWARAYLALTAWSRPCRRHYIAVQYRLTIRIRSDDTIRPNTNILFGLIFVSEANTKRIFGTSPMRTKEIAKT